MSAIVMVLALLAPGVPFPRLLLDQVLDVVYEEDEQAVADTLMILERSGDLSRNRVPRLGSVVVTERRLSARVTALLPLIPQPTSVRPGISEARSRLLSRLCEALAIWTRGYEPTARHEFERWVLGHLSRLAYDDDRALVPLVCVGARHDPVYVLRWMPVLLNALRERVRSDILPAIDVVEALAEALHQTALLAPVCRPSLQLWERTLAALSDPSSTPSLLRSGSNFVPLVTREAKSTWVHAKGGAS